LDILEDGVGDLDLDEEAAAVDRKKHTPSQKKMYKKHHKIRGSLVLAIPRAEYMKMSDKSTTKGPGKKIRRVASTTRSLDISLLIALIFRRRNQRTSLISQLSNQTRSSRV